MTATRAESQVRDVHLRPSWSTIAAVDRHGTTHRSRSDVSAVVADPDRPRYAPTDGPGPTTEIGIATERDHASTQEETDRVRGRVVGLVREIRNEVAVVIAAEIETGTGTGRAAGIMPGEPPTNPMPWRNTERW